MSWVCEHLKIPSTPSEQARNDCKATETVQLCFREDYSAMSIRYNVILNRAWPSGDKAISVQESSEYEDDTQYRFKLHEPKMSFCFTTAIVQVLPQI